MVKSPVASAYARHSATLRTAQFTRRPESHIRRTNSATAAVKAGEEASLPVMIATSTAEKGNASPRPRSPSAIMAPACGSAGSTNWL